jgi:hypothetical protein
MPWFARPMLILLSFILIGTLAWHGVQYALHGRHRNADLSTAQTGPNPAYGSAAAWQRDVIVALDESARHSTEGDVAQTEVSVDRVASILSLARLKSQSAPPDFFDLALAKLDQALSPYHQNTRLIEHFTLARIELAQLRSSLEEVPPGTPSSIQPIDLLLPTAAADPSKVETASESQAAAKSGTAKQPAGASDNLPPGNIFVGAPKTIALGSLLDPASLGGYLLDATAMPATAEILEPPSSRLFADNVRVENLTIAGAAQTLDGIHWKNVTFIGTRLRYEGGELDLHNVHFIHCMFGFTTDQRGARVANAIARGQNTLVIE